MPPSLILLDCDGVLVDSERITTILLAEVATELGWPVSAEQSIALFKGRDLHLVQQDIEARLGRPIGDGFIPDYRERMARRFVERGVPPLPGAPELLDWLDARALPHAVASNGPHEKMRFTLGRIGVTPRHAQGWFTRFEGRRFSAYDIDSWKPDPGLFLHAAAAMHAEPGRCVVVEDSPSGVRAGVAAGMRVIALADLTPEADLRSAGATEVCASLPGVLEVLRAWAG
jgi:beta-phosphoglucomutase-like phosphatase (HAD superfamily)